MQRRRPGALTALSVISIVLGALIVVGAFQGLIGLAFQSQLSDFSTGMSTQQPGMPEEMREANRQMQEDILAVQRTWNPFMWAVTPLAILFGIGLIVGGAMCVKLNPGGRRLLAYVCGGGIFFCLLREIAGIMMALEMTSSMQEHMAAMVPNGDAQGEAVMSGMMGATMAMSVAFGGAWMLLKLVFYLWGLIYLSREKTKEVFEGIPPE